MSPDAVICPSITKMYRIARIYAKLCATFVDLCARSLTNLCEWFVGQRWSFLWRIQSSAFQIGRDVDNRGRMWWNRVEFIEICSDSAELSPDAVISPSFTPESSNWLMHEFVADSCARSLAGLGEWNVGRTWSILWRNWFHKLKSGETSIIVAKCGENLSNLLEFALILQRENDSRCDDQFVDDKNVQICSNLCRNVRDIRQFVRAIVGWVNCRPKMIRFVIQNVKSCRTPRIMRECRQFATVFKSFDQPDRVLVFM